MSTYSESERAMLHAISQTDAGIRLASMLRGDVKLGDFRSALLGCIEAARASLPAPTGWQPISTAPKDGTKVLLGRFTGNKRSETEGLCAVDWWRLPEDRAGFVGFGKYNPTYWPPTHWMPLPAAPSQYEGKTNADQA